MNQPNAQLPPFVRPAYSAAMSTLVPLHLDHLRAAGCSEQTVKDRRKVLARLHDHLTHGLLFAETEEIEAWLATVGPSQWTRVTYSNHIRGFYRWACIAGYLDGDPAHDLPKPRRPRLVPRPVKIEQLAVALTAPAPWHIAVILAAYEGLRCCEIASCRREHISESEVFIPYGKGGDPRRIPCHPLVWATVRLAPPGLLITRPHGGQVTAHYLTTFARPMFDQLGLAITMHQLRHWYGTTLQEQNGDLRITQEALGHHSPTSTAGYTAVAASRLARAINALPVPKAKPAS